MILICLIVFLKENSMSIFVFPMMRGAVALWCFLPLCCGSLPTFWGDISVVHSLEHFHFQRFLTRLISMEKRKDLLWVEERVSEVKTKQNIKFLWFKFYIIKSTRRLVVNTKRLKLLEFCENLVLFFWFQHFSPLWAISWHWTLRSHVVQADFFA